MTSAAVLSFAPDARRAKALDERMHRDLTGSIAHLRDAAVDVAPHLAHALQSAVERLADGPAVPPEIFGAYYELVEQAAADNFDHAARIAGEIAKAHPRRNELILLARGTSAAAQVGDWLDRRMGEEAKMFAPVPDSMKRDFAARLEAGFDLLSRAVPELAAEIRGLVHVILLAQAPKGATRQFDGASHYQFWGLLLLNPNFHRTPLAVAEVLAHEAGHSLLFGMTVDEPLVLNPDDELFSSPLRTDLRPMDGILHATFVSARMAWTMEKLAVSNLLSDTERGEAHRAAETDRRNFAAGDAVLRASARLSETGRIVIESARRWIADGAA